MAEQDLEHPQIPIDTFATVGERLRQARERLGLSRADIAARTKIAERHLAAIEDERFADLASSTYAVGFSRAYARAVGLDEREIAQAVRIELDMVENGDARPAPTFEPGDPARVPSSRTAWLAGAAALAVVVALLVFWRGYYFPAGSLPDLTADAPRPPVTRRPIVSASAAAALTPTGPVTITSRQAGVWVKVTDATGRQLFQKQLARGESYTVPADAERPQLRTARPDALSITVGGRLVPPLAEVPSVITAPISAAALLARGAPTTPAPAPAPAPTVQPPPRAAAPAPAPRPSASATAAAQPKPSAAPRSPRPSPSAVASSPVPATVATTPARAPAAAKPTAAPAPASTPAAVQPAPTPAPAAEMPKASTVSE
jgi:cytoskeletal protein RodZ